MDRAVLADGVVESPHLRLEVRREVRDLPDVVEHLDRQRVRVVAHAELARDRRRVLPAMDTRQLEHLSVLSRAARQRDL